jgi:hypothetical protein
MKNKSYIVVASTKHVKNLGIDNQFSDFLDTSVLSNSLAFLFFGSFAFWV